MTGDATPLAVLSRRTIARASVLAAVTGAVAWALGGPAWVVVAWVPAWLVVVEAWVGSRLLGGTRGEAIVIEAAFVAAPAVPLALLQVVHVNGVLAAGFTGGHTAVADAVVRGAFAPSPATPFGQALAIAAGVGMGASAVHLARASSQAALARGARTDLDELLVTAFAHVFVAFILAVVIAPVGHGMAPEADGLLYGAVLAVVCFLVLGVALHCLDAVERVVAGPVTASR